MGQIPSPYRRAKAGCYYQGEALRRHEERQAKKDRALALFTTWISIVAILWAVWEFRFELFQFFI